MESYRFSSELLTACGVFDSCFNTYPGPFTDEALLEYESERVNRRIQLGYSEVVLPSQYLHGLTAAPARIVHWCTYEQASVSRRAKRG